MSASLASGSGSGSVCGSGSTCRSTPEWVDGERLKNEMGPQSCRWFMCLWLFAAFVQSTGHTISPEQSNSVRAFQEHNKRTLQKKEK